jgi:Ca2+-binding EF-hand superfamily protein
MNNSMHEMSKEQQMSANFDPKNPGDDMRKAMDTQFDVADQDRSGELDYDEFKRLNEYWATNWKQWVDEKGGQHHWKAIFADEDYNNDGMISMGELYMAMMRSQMSEEDMKMGFEMANRHANKEGMLDWDHYMMMVEEYEMAMEGDHDGDRGDGSGPRMEMNMEKLPDGTERMTIVMEGAQKLAISAAALAAASFFAY